MAREGDHMTERARIRADRPRLEAALEQLPEGGIALIAGGAGYGKSSAVAAWSTRQRGATRWLRSSRGLPDALRLAHDEDDGVRLPRLARATRRGSTVGECASALIADLAAPHMSLTLVIDDADALAADLAGCDFLRRVAERDPDRSRIILIGRRATPLRLAAAQSKRVVIEISAPDLRISPLQTRQIAEARGWRGDGGELETARRAAAGNGGILAAWAASQGNTPQRGRADELRDFICRDVVGETSRLLERLANGGAEHPDPALLEALWAEGLLLAPVQQDELGGGGWQLPALIADALGLPIEIPNAPSEPKPFSAQRTQVAVHEPAASLVKVHDLGPLTLDIAEGTIDGTSIRPRSLGLLLYLATRPRHAATREEAIEALWPDAEEDAGLNSLNQAIFHLRRTIDPEYDAARSSNVAYVRHEGEVVSLHPELVRFDSAALATGLDRLPRRPSAEEIDALFDTYRGPFGMELPYETWVQSYRETLEVGLLSVAERAVITACDAGDLDRAVDLALRTTRIDPSDGALLERLALLLDETGAAASARRAARRAIALLDEVSVEVPVELLRLGSLPQKRHHGSTK